MTLSRRTILGTAAALPLAAWAERAAPQPELDVAVVGGGVSGAYTAWRLRQDRPDLRVGLFEMSDRIGGRLRSIAFPQAPHLFGEAGGMRFLQAQKHVFNLVKHLNLPMRGYPTTLPQDRMLLRGRDFSLAEMGQATKLYPYNIPAADQSPTSPLFMDGIARIVPGARTMTPAKWKQIRTTLRHKGRLLKDWSAWALLADVFSMEEMRFMQDASGYDDIALYETALDECDYVFLADDESKPFFTLVGGYQRLPVTLAESARNAGAGVTMQTSLVSLRHEGDAFRLMFLMRDGLHAIHTKKVVLAMPRRALEAIGEALKPAADLLAGVVPVPACKGFLLYPKPWWRERGVPAGRSITDMPVRQFYALGAEKERLPIEPTNGMGLLMMYSDSITVEYWKELVPKAPASAAGFQWLSGDSQFATEMHREAGLVYQAGAPKPLAACFQDWTAEPFGGGWHYWAPGRDGYALADRVMQPLPGQNLFICGEAYGIYPAGWVEGALERAETMLQRHFGLKKAPWLA